MSAGPLDSWSVVVVDDLADLRKVLRLMLEHGGPFKVVGEGANGDEAVALAAELHPDVLLMDVEMPGGATGWQALPRIKEVAPETAVVILSGSRADPAAPPGGGLAAAVLEKGLAPEQLTRALLAVVGAPTPVPTTAAAAPLSRGSGTEPVREPLEEPGVTVDRFASVAGHDLAQPLQVAYGYLEMLRSDFGEGLDPTAAQWLDAALGSLERMRRLVQAVLAYARVGARKLVPGDVDLGEAVDLALGSLDHVAVEVRRGDLPVVQASMAEVVDVLTQLLANAVAHAAGVVRVGLVEDGVVEVEDDGPGVPEALREKLFEPFERAGAHAGAGLGLAVAGRLVERLGGRLWLEPEPPTRFRFSLPGPLT